ncbi:MAG: 3-dehydroquinate synthase [Candidatus Nanopelagicales bacterium]|nr:3-dehydroquinate synthase [Candidatus Nanopelagicales bacterium]
MNELRIAIRAEHEYDVIIGRGLLGALPALLEGSGRVAIVHAPPLARTALTMRDALEQAGHSVLLIGVPDAEDAKTALVLQDCWDRLGAAGFTRNDAIVGLGGGATTDLAGFVAATWLRGVRVVQVPTTLLAMVDAAVGGKTGINTAAGKNLVGAFHSASGVLCDLDLLGSLEPAELVAGMAEVVKVGLTSDPEILRLIQVDPGAAADPQGEVLQELVRRAVQVKADVVGGDFREVRSGAALGREVLNYGHTFGHAVERLEHYRWRHGAAISVGLCFVAELARLGGRLNDADADLHQEILGSLGLPTTYAPGHWAALLDGMQHDKKTRGSVIRFVVLEGIGQPVAWDGPDPALLEAAYAAISRS